MRPRQTGRSDGALISQFAHDPDMRELIDYFLEQLAQRAGAIQTAFSEGQANELGMLAHQLKGAAAGYGFPSLGASAGELEALVKACEAEASTVAERVEDLIGLCRRAAAGGRPAIAEPRPGEPRLDRPS